MKYFDLYNSFDIDDEESFNSIKEDLADSNEIPVEEVPDEWVYDSFYDYLDDLRRDLDIQIEGDIIAFCDLGYWNGRSVGYKRFGTNIKEIFTFCSCDGAEWYADEYNVRANLYHHDGTHRLVFRYVKTGEELKRICNAISNGKIKSEKDFFQMTKSIRPFIAEAYGWQEYGKQAHKEAA